MEVEMGTNVTSSRSVVKKGTMGTGGNASSLTTGLMSGEVKPSPVPMSVVSHRRSTRTRAATS